ncbi:MAG: tautomerase family protein [Thermosphaera aggregans]|jgi:4-oxalocrotonate tautomerase|uniref:tautomerase family protein n=1 Tax=Thermosphaera aggregans TaxID=54254 RepID=UPI003C0AC555
MAITIPIVHVYVWSGVSRQAREKMIKGITKAFEELGIPGHAVDVGIHEVPRENWGVGREQASEKFKEKRPS